NPRHGPNTFPPELAGEVQMLQVRVVLFHNPYNRNLSNSTCFLEIIMYKKRGVKERKKSSGGNVHSLKIDVCSPIGDDNSGEFGIFVSSNQIIRGFIMKPYSSALDSLVAVGIKELNVLFLRWSCSNHGVMVYASCLIKCNRLLASSI